MSMFIHRCGECGHNHLEHENQVTKGSACSYGWCSCTRLLPEVLTAEPELIPTFKFGTLDRVEIIAEPGSQIGSQAQRVRACSCTACCEAYDHTSGGVA